MTLSMKQQIENWKAEINERIGEPYFEKTLFSNLFFLWKKMRLDNDACVIIDGCTGSGKSTIAHQLCCCVDPSYPGENHERICDNPEKLLKALEHSKPYQAINVDEASVSGLSSRSSGSKTGISIQTILEICRAKKLFFCFCLPSFFQLNKYIREDRVDCLIHIAQRGSFFFYDRKGAKQLSTKCFRYHNYLQPAFMGWFRKDVPEQVDIEQYKKNKMANINLIIKQARGKIAEHNAETNPEFISLNRVAKSIGISNPFLVAKVESGEIKGKRFGRKWFIMASELDKLRKP